MEIFRDLSEILPFCWQELTKSAYQKKHPWRYPVLANAANGQVEQRTVVLRQAKVAERRLRFYTDVRSAKMEAVQNNNAMAWLFYHPRKQLQLRVQSRPQLLPIEEAKRIWQQLPVVARSSYASIAAPGSNSLLASNGLPPDFYERDRVATDYAFEHFRVVDTIVYEVEVLQLHREGHRRAKFSWSNEKEEWKGVWLIA